MKKLLKSIIYGFICEQCTKALFMEDLVNNCNLEKKEKKENAERKNVNVQMRNPNTGCVW